MLDTTKTCRKQTTLELRDYQIDSLNGLRQGFAQGHSVQLLYGPCSFGKTEVAIAMLKSAAEKGNRAAMVMDRRVLVEQTSERLSGYGLEHGIAMAGHWRYLPHKPIQICSAQTIEKRGLSPDLSLLIIDECHSMRRQTKDFIKNNPLVKVVGLSGSPTTRGLGSIFTNVVSRITIAQLIGMDKLAPLRVFIAKQIDMTGAKKVAGEWAQGEATVRGVQITGDVVTEWIKKTHEIFGEPRKTIVFVAGVAHGASLAKEFQTQGYNFINISYKDDDDFKAQTIKEFSKVGGDVIGIIACDILTKGFSCDDIEIMISARPFSKSFSSHIQQLGRGMRTHPGKAFCVLLDHSGNFLRFLDDWDDLYKNGVSSLDDGREKSKAEPTDKEKEAAKCAACGELWGPTDVCQHCGAVRKRRNDVEVLPGRLEEICVGKSKVKAAENLAELYAMCCTYARSHSMSDKQSGRAAHLYKDLVGVWPPSHFNFESTQSVEISRPVLNQIRRKNIAYRSSAH